MSYNFGYIESKVFHKYINKQSIIYDIGAYSEGAYTKLFAQLGKFVIAFEPSQNNYKKLLENTRVLFNVLCYDYALHEKEYECVTRFKECNGIEDPEQFIKYKRLDEIVKIHNLPLPDFIKCDCEGMESILFKTFDFLFENKTIFWVEIHYNADKNNPSPQTYEDNPSWTHIENNGYDWNKIKNYNYILIGIRGVEAYIIPNNVDYNENINWEGVLIIHESKWNGL